MLGLEKLGGLYFLVGYILLLSAFLFVFLFGEAAVFEGTFIARWHEFLNGGLCLWIRALMGWCCGVHGLRAYAGISNYCCSRRNPLLQLFYLGLMAGAYTLAGTCCWHHIPGPYVHSSHRYLGPLFVTLCLCSFLLACASDPGTITPANIRRHLQSYPYDNAVYSHKTCSSCNIPRPARSKHCRVCDRCVARFDHHCAWMNNCVGEHNLRLFLLFLLSHCLLCWYATGLIVAILMGELQARSVYDAALRSEDGSLQPLSGHPRLLLMWLVSHFSQHVLLVLFSVLVSLLVAGFLGYHLWLISRNTTTNETFKFEDYKRWLMSQEIHRLGEQEENAQQRHSDDRRESMDGASGVRSESEGERSDDDNDDVPAGTGSVGNSIMQRWRLWELLSLKRTSRGPQPAATFKNVYDRGVYHNFLEAFFPPSLYVSKKASTLC